MDGSYGTYVDDEYVDNHDYDDDTDGDTDDDIDDDTDDDNDHKKDSYTAASAAPDAGAAPDIDTTKIKRSTFNFFYLKCGKPCTRHRALRDGVCEQLKQIFQSPLPLYLRITLHQPPCPYSFKVW